MTDESTQPGDSVEVTDVDTAAQALLARRQEVSIDPEVTEEVTEEVIEEEAIEAESTDEEDAEESEPEASFESLSELAEAAGMDLDDFIKSVKAKTKVQGEENEVTLAELIKGYQLESDYTRKNEALIQSKKEWEAQQAQAQAKLSEELQRTGYAFKMAQNQLTHDFNAIDWVQLEKDDPQDFLIQRQKFGERQAQLDQAINQATQQATAIKQRQQQQYQAQTQQYLTQQEELLLKALPEWSNADTRQAETARVVDYLTNQGFSSEEVANIKDHRIIVMAQKAMAGDKVATDVDLAKKKVKRVPKLVKPNARQSQSEAAAKRTKKLMHKAFNTGRNEDIAAALLSRRK